MSEDTQITATVLSSATTQFIRIGREDGKSAFAKIVINCEEKHGTTFSLEVRLINEEVFSGLAGIDVFKKLEETFDDTNDADKLLRITKASFELFITPFSAQLRLHRSMTAKIVQALRSFSRNIQDDIQGESVEPIAELPIGNQTYILYRHSVFDADSRYSLLTENGKAGNVKMTPEDAANTIIGQFNNGIVFS